MKEELELKLVSKYPDLCINYKGDKTKTSFHWGFECEDGWYDLIDNTFFSINLVLKKNFLNAEIAQVKSKFGALTIYIDFEQGPKGPHIQQAITQVNQIIENARKCSCYISEISGKPASQHIINNWVYTVTQNEALAISGRFHPYNS